MILIFDLDRTLFELTKRQKAFLRLTRKERRKEKLTWVKTYYPEVRKQKVIKERLSYFNYLRSKAQFTAFITARSEICWDVTMLQILMQLKVSLRNFFKNTIPLYEDDKKTFSLYMSEKDSRDPPRKSKFKSVEALKKDLIQLNIPINQEYIAVDDNKTCIDLYNFLGYKTVNSNLI